MQILNTIRQKPDSQKKILSLVLAFILTLFIVGFWFSFDRKSASNDMAGEEVSKLSSISPIQMIKEEFSKAFSGFSEIIN